MSRCLPILAVVIFISGCVTRNYDYGLFLDGDVYEESGEHLADVDVTLELNEDVYDVLNPVRTSKQKTDSEGKYSFFYITHSPEVKYSLTFSKDGYFDQRIEGSEMSKTETVKMISNKFKNESAASGTDAQKTARPFEGR